MRILTCLLLTSCLSLVSQAQDVSLESDSVWVHRYDRGYPNNQFLIDGEDLYFGSDMTRVKKLNAKTGQLIWEAEPEVGFKGYIHNFVHDDDHIYVHGTSRFVYKLKKSDGQIVWSYKAKFDDDVMNQLILQDETLYMNPLDSGYFLALYPSNGNVRWITDLSTPVLSYTMDASTIYGHQYDGKVISLNASTGKLMKERQVFDKSRIYYQPAVYGNNLILCNSRNTVVALDKKTLETRWIDSTGAFSNIATTSEALFAYNGESFVRINPENGKKIWSVPSKGRWLFKPTIRDNRVYLQTRRQFLILDLKSGKELYSSEFNHKSYTRPIVTKKHIYLGYGGTIMKVKKPK